MSEILIIDDEESMRFVIRGILEHEGYSSQEASDGDEGIQLCQTLRPSLVITDLVMPNKEGIETIIEIRRSYPDTKIIAISGGGGLDPSSFLSAAKALGADAVLRKPFRSAELIATVRDLIPEETPPT